MLLLEIPLQKHVIMRRVGWWNTHKKEVVNKTNLKNISRTMHEIFSFLKAYIQNTWLNPWKNTLIKVSSKWYAVLLLLCMSTATWWQFTMCLFADTEIHWHKNPCWQYRSVLHIPQSVLMWSKLGEKTQWQNNKAVETDCRQFTEWRRSLTHS
jgi:hypothetical protein